MATFSEFLNILPDPNYKIGTAGESSSSGTAGAGFASIKLSSDAPIMRDRTNSGRLVSRSAAYHRWDIDISYNPMTREEFDPIFTFLLEKQGSLKPFFISLPNYRAGATNTTVSGGTSAGSSTLLILNTNCAPGDLFHIEDPFDSAHTKAYKVLRVEDTTTYNTTLGSPGTGNKRIHILPPLQKAVSSVAVVNFSTPLIKVIQSGDIQEYSLNNNNLYSFSLKVEEACS
jgi:hypothetical protein